MDQDGSVLVEYGLLVVLVAIGLIVTLTAFRETIIGKFNEIKDSIAGAK
jgi:Flp pilus assembly pilin Flp